MAAKSLVFRFGDVEVREREFSIVKAGAVLPVEPKAFRVLLHLLRSPQKLIPKEELLTAVWGETAVTENSLTRSIALLRRLLGDEARDPHFIETVATVGYRFLCDVQVTEDGFAGPSGAAHSQNCNEENSNEFEPLGALGAEATPPTVRETAKRWKMIVAVAAAALVLAIAAAFLYQRSSPGHGATSNEWEQLTARFLNRDTHAAVASLAVLPLTNLSGDPNEEYFADGMTAELTTMLANDSTLRIVSSTSAMQFKAAHRSLPEIARALNVDAILEGSISRSSNQVHMTLQLIRGDTDSHLWAESYDRNTNDVAALPDDAARVIAARLNSATPPHANARYIKPEARDAYLRGHYYWVVGRNKDAGRYYQRAVDIQPDYALGWSGLADYYVEGAIDAEVDPLQALPQAEAAARKAVELDDSLPRAHVSLGGAIFFNRGDGVQALK